MRHGSERRTAGALAVLVHALALCALLAAPAPAGAEEVRPALAGGVVRTYYIAAEEIDWDYAPAGRDEMMGRPFGDAENVFVAPGEGRAGSRYRKTVYVEYEDAAFTRVKPRLPAWRHAGLLGPILRAEVGDSLRVVFRNNSSRPYSMHPHGVFYEKAHEGAMTNDGTGPADKAGDAVAPGDTHTYIWQVPERAGPGPGDPSSLIWVYHSHVDTVKDTNTGLIGAIIVAARGRADEDGVPRDVDREVVTLFKIYDENKSWQLEESLRRAGTDPASADLDGEEFQESNLMHAINGYVYGSMPMPRLVKGERVRWYLIAMGSEPDLHKPHWHGNTALWENRRVDVVPLLPAQTIQADMVPDAAGIWMFHCHVDDHISAGMTARYQVVEE